MTEDSFRDLYDALYPTVLRFVKGGLSNPVEVEEVVQDVFVRVARNYSGYRGQASLQTWVLAIAKNVLVDYWRKRQRERTVRGQSLDGALAGDDLLRTPHQADPAEQLATQDELDRIRACIEALPTSMRLVLLCRLYQDLSNTETAQVLGWTAARVRVTYSRALRRFTTVWTRAEQVSPTGPATQLGG